MPMVLYSIVSVLIRASVAFASGVLDRCDAALRHNNVFSAVNEIHMRQNYTTACLFKQPVLFSIFFHFFIFLLGWLLSLAVHM